MIKTIDHSKHDKSHLYTSTGQVFKSSYKDMVSHTVLSPSELGFTKAKQNFII